MIKIFHYNDYRSFIVDQLEFLGRGVKTQFSKAIHCESSYLTQILNQKKQMSLEQAEAAGRFLKLNKIEIKYFLLLLQIERAGSKELKSLFEAELLNLRKKLDRTVLAPKEVELLELSQDVESARSLKWYTSIIHMLTESPRFQTIDALAQALDLKKSEVKKSLQLLLSLGLIKKENGLYKGGLKGVIYPSPSELVKKYNRYQWMHKITDRIMDDKPMELMLLTTAGSTKAELHKLKKDLAAVIEKHGKSVAKSNIETVYTLSVQLFSLIEDSAH